MATRLLTYTDYFPDPNVPFAVVRRYPQEPCTLHSHEFSELTIILDGKGNHVTEHGEYQLRSGDVFVIQGTQIHGYRHLDNLQLVNLLYVPEALHTYISDLLTLSGYHAMFRLEPQYRDHHRFRSCLHLAPESLEQIKTLIDNLETELEIKKPGYEFLARTYFLQIIGYLSRCYASAQTPASRPLLRIGDALSHLEHHYNQPISLEKLATIAHMSQSSLVRAFKRTTGLPPNEYHRRLRISKACQLLRDTRVSITEVSSAVGFADSNYFARQFRNIMKVSPSTYRKRGSVLPVKG